RGDVMSDLTVSPALLRPVAAAPSAQGADLARARRVAQDFEASFVSQMLQPMFAGLETDGPFGGGQGEATWRSFLRDEMAKQVVRAGGLGLADRVMGEMLRMQGLDPDGAPIVAAPVDPELQS